RTGCGRIGRLRLNDGPVAIRFAFGMIRAGPPFAPEANLSAVPRAVAAIVDVDVFVRSTLYQEGEIDPLIRQSTVQSKGIRCRSVADDGPVEVIDDTIPIDVQKFQ